MEFTKERFLKIQSWSETYGPGSNVVLPAEEAAELARMALAAMDSEPVKRVNADQMRRVCLEANRHLDKYGAMAKEVNKLLGRISAQPAPVVPDAATAIRACLSEFPESARDIVEECADIAENACRSAMLQDEPVTTANKLPFEQWLSQQTGTIDVECGCVMTEVFFHWLRVAYEAGNSLHCREILNSSTNNFRENAETSTKCPKCGGRGSYHCPQMLGTVECECTLSAPQEVAIR